MPEIERLSTLLDDPEVRVLIFGRAHVGPVTPAVVFGAPRLHAVVLHLAETIDAGQYGSLLADTAPNTAMTVEQVRAAVGDDAIADLAESTAYNDRSTGAFSLERTD